MNIFKSKIVSRKEYESLAREYAELKAKLSGVSIDKLDTQNDALRTELAVKDSEIANLKAALLVKDSELAELMHKLSDSEASAECKAIKILAQVGVPAGEAPKVTRQDVPRFQFSRI